MGTKLIILISLVLLTSLTSAAILEPTTWDDKVSFKETGKYGRYEINDTTFWLFNNKPVKTIDLIENDWSLWYGWNIQEITLHKNSKLVDKTEFFEIDKRTSKEEFIESKKVEYRKLLGTTTLKQNNPCISYGKTYGECIEWDTTYYSVNEKNWSNWQIYNYETLEEGTYQVKTTVKRNSLSSGLIEWIDTNEGHRLEEWATWWNDSLAYRRAINGSNSEFIMAVNRSNNTAATSDIDGDGGVEILYGVPNLAYVYYNDDTDTFNANETTELCLFDSFSNRSQCTNPPTGLKGFFPFDYNWLGVGDLSNDITFANPTTTTGFSHSGQGTVNFSYSASTSGTGKHYLITDNADVDFGTGDFAIVFDANPTATQWAYTKSWYIYSDDTSGGQMRFYDGSTHQLDSGTDVTNSGWWCTVVQRSGTNLTMWLNGSNVDSATFSTDLDNANNVLLGWNGGNRMIMDNLYIFKGRALTYDEIQEICKTDKYTTYLGSQEEGNLVPTITVTSPVNNTESFWTNQTFVGTAIDYDGNVSNVSIYLDNVINQTNTSGLNNTAYSFDITGIPYGLHTWILEVCDTSSSCTNSSARVINITRWIINSVSYSSTASTLDLESFTINISSSLTINNITMDYEGYDVPLTNQGSGIWNTSLQLNSSLSGTNTFFFNISQTNNWSLSSNYTQTVSDFVFVLCNSTYNQTYLNITFKDEGNLTNLNASIPAATFTANVVGSGDTYEYIFSNTSENPSYYFCAFPTDIELNVNYQIQYESTNYPQRINELTTLLTNATTNQTFYLLNSADGQYVTFQVINVAEQPLQNVNVSAYRSISGSDVLISFGQTASDGGITFWLDPDFEHTFFFNHSSYESVLLTNFPTQSSYTVTMGGTSTTDFDYNKGILVSILPTNLSLFNNTAYNFNITVTSDYWTIDGFGFSLGNSSSTIFNTTSSTSDGGSVQVTKNTDSNEDIVMNYFYIINGTSQNFTRTWIVYDSGLASYSISNFASNLNDDLDNGIFGAVSSTKEILSFLFIFLFTGIMSYNFGIRSYAALISFVFGLVLFLDIGIGVLPNVNGVHFITVLMGILTIGILYREVLR